MIHYYKLHGFNILMDTNSGAVHLLDELCFDMLPYINPPMTEPEQQLVDAMKAKGYSASQISDGYAELLTLYKSGELFSEDDSHLADFCGIPAPIKAACLHVAHDCNLRCKYCFAEDGNFGGCKELMSLETAKKAIDFLIVQSKGRKNLELDFFGGEPLMNFDVVMKTVEYARAEEMKYNKNFRFTITTNGMLLDDAKIDFINREMSNVVLSLDGRKEVNDRMRIRSDGSGSYDRIVPKMLELVRRREGGPFDQYYVRGTYTRYNLDFAEDVLHLADLGFEQISVEPVVAPEEAAYSLRESELETIFAEYERLAVNMLEQREKGRYFNFFHFMLDLDQGPCAIKRIRGCGCGNEYVAITPSGDIYPCHQFVGMEDQKMGSLYDGTLDLEKKKIFSCTDVFSKEDCSQCWAKFYCSGGCNANNYIYNHNLLKPHKISCAIEKKRIECSIMLQAAEMSEDE